MAATWSGVHPSRVTRLRVGTALEQEPGDRRTSAARRDVERGPAPAVLDVEVGPGVEEQDDHVGAIVVAGPVQRRAAVAADRIDRRAGRDQFREDPPVAADPGPVEGGVSRFVAGVDGLRRTLDEPVDGVIVAPFGGIDDIGDEVLGVAPGAGEKEDQSDPEPAGDSIDSHRRSPSRSRFLMAETSRIYVKVRPWLPVWSTFCSFLQARQGVVDDQAPVPFSLGSATRRDGEPLEKTVGRADQNLIQVRFEARGYPHTRRDR